VESQIALEPLGDFDFENYHQTLGKIHLAEVGCYSRIRPFAEDSTNQHQVSPGEAFQQLQ